MGCGLVVRKKQCGLVVRKKQCSQKHLVLNSKEF